MHKPTITALLLPLLTQAALAQPAAAPVLAFILETTTTRTLDQGVTPRDPGPKVTTRRSRVTMRPNRVSWLDLESGEEVLLDRKQRRLFYIDHRNKRWDSEPLLAWIAGLDREKAHRWRLREVTKVVEDERLDAFAPFWLESQFRSGNTAAKEAEIAEEEGRITCAYQKKKIFECVTDPDSGQKIDPALRPAWNQFLIRALQVHPKIRAVLARMAKTPKSIRYTLRDTGTRVDTVVAWKPLPKDADPVAATDLGDVTSKFGPWVRKGDALGALFADIEAKRIGKTQPSQADYAKQIRAAAEAGQHLGGFLLLMESSFTYPDTAVRQLARGFDFEDPHLAAYIESLRRGQGEREAKKGEELIRKVPRDGLPSAATLDIHHANFLCELERSAEAKALFLKVLRARPWLAGPFKDLGDLYAREFDMHRAWRCWERAEQLAPKHPLLEGFQRLREQLRTEYADWL